MGLVCVVDGVADKATSPSEEGSRGGWGFATLSLLVVEVGVVVVVEDARSPQSLSLTVSMDLWDAMVRRRIGSVGARAAKTSTAGTRITLPEGQVVSSHLTRTPSWRGS